MLGNYIHTLHVSHLNTCCGRSRLTKPDSFTEVLSLVGSECSAYWDTLVCRPCSNEYIITSYHHRSIKSWRSHEIMQWVSKIHSADRCGTRFETNIKMLFVPRTSEFEFPDCMVIFVNAHYTVIYLLTYSQVADIAIKRRGFNTSKKI